MSRLSRDQKREFKRQHSVVAPEATPIEVRVPVPAGGSGDGATIGGIPVVPAPGETVQAAVLNHLHRHALATGRTVLASIHDERIGFVVPLQVYADGSSRYAGEPVRVGPPADTPSVDVLPVDALPVPAEAPPVPLPPPAPTAPPAPPSAVPRRDRATSALRAVPEPDLEPKPLPGAASTHGPRAVPERVPGVGFGDVAAPTGEFGPPPELPGSPSPRSPSPRNPSPRNPSFGSQPLGSQPFGGQALGSQPVTPEWPEPARKAPAVEAMSVVGSEPESEPKPTPARGFDAVAESVLAPVPTPGEEGAPESEGAAFLAEPVARINEAVKQGRIDEAAGMAERAGAEASRSLGPEHPEVLRLRELTAYIAYLAGDPLRAFHLSLELAQARRRHRDPDAAYGNVQSAAAAWRAVRDPAQGLNLGRDLITLWTELVDDGGPAADDLDQLDSARTRMTRLADRARAKALADNPYTQSPPAHGH